MLRPFRPAAYFLLAFLLLCSAPAQSLPHGGTDLARRQALTGPQTVQTVTTTDTADGVVTETCNITLTPTTDANGQGEVIEVKECSVTLTSSGSSGPPNPGESAAPTDTASVTVGLPAPSLAPPAESSSAAAAPTTLSVPASIGLPGLSSIGLPPLSSASASVSSSASASAAATNAAISVIGTTSVTESSTPTLSTTSSSTSASSTTVATSTTAAAQDNGGSATISSAAQSGTAAAENASTSASATPFTLPGKKLQVLPIGLGVFAGISVIALIVVALVTYERTKYRKAFRQRKLAESGAGMGYGGMAQRV